MAVFTTSCPRNCYSTCGIRATVEDGRLIRLEPHEQNRATPEGICLKGLSYIERVYAKDRILRPLRRSRAGDFEPISWSEALTVITENLTSVRERFGPKSLFFYSGSGTKGLLNRVGLDFWRLFGGCTTTYGDLCWPAGLEATRLTLGDNKHSAPWDLAEAKLILFWGKNPAETNIHQMRFVQQAKERGAKVVVIDPRRTETAEAADLLVQIRPGTDGALALGLAHLLIREGSVKRSFVDRYVLGFEAFRERVARYPPARVAEITGVPEILLERLAGQMGSIEPMTICAGYGMQRFTNSGQTLRAMLAILALTGNIGRPGAGWVYANLQSHIFDSVKDPLALYPPERDRDGVRVSVSTALLGRHLLDQKDPPVKMAWIERGNPVTQNPDTHRVLEAMRGLEFRVVVDQFMTDTAREADIVLPAKSMFEQTDVIGAYWHPYLQIKRKLIEPPGEVKPESEIYYLLAERMGLLDSAACGVLPEASDEAIDAYLRRHLEAFPGLTLEALDEGPVLAPGHQEVAFSDLVFPTPSGKIELLSEEARLRWGTDALPDFIEPRESPQARVGAGAYSLHLLTPNTKDRIHSQFNNLPSIRALQPKSLIYVHPNDAGARDIADGAMVRVLNDRGSVELEAKWDYGIKPGCVSVSNGWWLSEGGGINRLSAARETDMGHGAAFHDNAVEIELLES